MQHNHTFEYRLVNGEDFNQPNQEVRFIIDGNVNLDTMLEQFELYLKAVGFVPPDNCRLEYVEQSISQGPEWNPPPIDIPSTETNSNTGEYTGIPGSSMPRCLNE